jgi:holo-[acyl-carrier protein] synthase
VIRTGIDLASITRIKEALDKNAEGFLRRVCTTAEVNRLLVEKRQEQKIAGLFALKEAFSKALGTGLAHGVSFHDFEVSYTFEGAPQIKYIGKTFKRSATWDVSCSLSHEGDMVAAIVVVQGEIG